MPESFTGAVSVRAGLEVAKFYRELEVQNMAETFEQQLARVQRLAENRYLEVEREALAAVLARLDAQDRLIAQLLAACRESRTLYDELSMGPLEMAAAYGPDAEPFSDEECLAIRANLESAIAAAEAAGFGEKP